MPLKPWKITQGGDSIGKLVLRNVHLLLIEYLDQFSVENLFSFSHHQPTKDTYIKHLQID
jgi:hypothetical protein